MLKNTDGTELTYASLSKEELVLLEDFERMMKKKRQDLILLAFEPGTNG